jgi:predicted RNA-binding Zn ribbon-like protein
MYTGCILRDMTPPLPEPRPFRYIAGDPSLDLVNTVDWTTDGLIHERLVDYSALLTWQEGAGLLEPGALRRLRRRAASHRAEAERAHAEAMRLRALVREASLGLLSGSLESGILDRFNRVVQRALAQRRLEAVPRGRHPEPLRWEWLKQDQSLEAPLWPVALASAMLLTSPDAARIRVCEGPICGWMYVDRSRNGLRRWCAMDMCGGREKARRHYARVRASRERE